MQHTTAQNIIKRIVTNDVIKLRKSKYGGLSDKTYKALTDQLLQGTCASVEFKFYTLDDRRRAKLTTYDKIGNVLFESDKIYLI